jgi:ABC-type transport system involved in cytochrome c biogenesis ATPase subunit
MRIRKVTIKGLFDLFDHEIPFKTKERVTIIHGPNGVGKTTILRLLADLFSRRLNSLRVIPYRILTIRFEKPDRTLTVQRIPPKKSNALAKLEFRLSGRGRRPDNHVEKEVPEDFRAARRVLPFHAMDDLVPSLERIGARQWLDRRTGEVLDLEEVLMIYGDELPPEFQAAVVPRTQAWLKSHFDGFRVHFIQTQRLFAIQPVSGTQRRYRESKHSTTVERYSDEMVGRIQDSLRQSGVIGASLDRTFPHRLLQTAPPSDATEERIRGRYEKQAEYRTRLMAAGLMDPEDPVELPSGTLDRSARNVLWHYLNDVDEKFSVYDTLLKRVELFKDIINTRFLYKKFSVNKEDGFVFETDKKKSVPLKTLSSGEQHELVLAFDLLFRVKEGTMILIDEPELSLHVTWQHKFLEDIARISELADLDFLVATHSPSIIHKKTHLMVPLGEKE